MLKPFEERRARLKAWQAHVENELERLGSVELNSGGSEKITIQILDLDRE